MLRLHDEINVFERGETHRGVVLGSDGDLFWLLVEELNEVHRGHRANIFEREGVKYLDAAEWRNKLENMFDASGKFSSEAFWHSKNPEPMIKLIQAHLLLRPIRSRAS